MPLLHHTMIPCPKLGRQGHWLWIGWLRRLVHNFHLAMLPSTHLWIMCHDLPLPFLRHFIINLFLLPFMLFLELFFLF